jgi:hypothetical protein
VNISEANAVNRILTLVAGIDALPRDVEDQLREDAVYLADQAHRQLHAGLTGKRWLGQRLMTDVNGLRP